MATSWVLAPEERSNTGTSRQHPDRQGRRKLRVQCRDSHETIFLPRSLPIMRPISDAKFVWEGGGG